MPSKSPPQSLFGSSGIRGRVHELITGPFAIRVGLAAAQFLRNNTRNPSILIGHDHRTTGPMITSALMSGLLQGGIPVRMVGMAPTPTIAYAAGREGMSASIIVTASHNPPEYNGFKFHNPDGAGFSIPQQNELEQLLDTAVAVSWKEFTKSSAYDAIPLHITALLDNCEVNTSHQVVIDAALGVED